MAPAGLMATGVVHLGKRGAHVEPGTSKVMKSAPFAAGSACATGADWASAGGTVAIARAANIASAASKLLSAVEVTIGFMLWSSIPSRRRMRQESITQGAQD